MTRGATGAERELPAFARRDVEPGPTRHPWLAIALVSLAAALLRLATRSVYPAAWDPANFALAVERIDLPAHQPHPPASIGYVLAARLLLPLLGDATLALVAVNVLLTAAAGPLVYALAAHAGSAHPARRGWFAACALLASPLFWFHGCVAEIYVAETVLGMAVAYACLRLHRGDGRAAAAGGTALAVLGAFRVTGAVFLLPLYAAPLAASRSRPVIVRGALALVAGTALWAVPFLAWVGPDTWLHVLTTHFTRTAEPTSILAHGTTRVLGRHLRDVFQALLAGVGLFHAIALPLFVLLRRPRLWPRSALAVGGALWVVPGLAFYVLVHMAKPGYVLPAVPALCLVLAFLYAQEPRTALRVALLAGQVVAGAWQFLLAEPASGEAIGEGLSYSRKTWVQKARVELNSVLQTSRSAIALSDAQIDAVRREVGSACPGVVLVGRDHAGPNWRKLMVVFPEATAVRLPSAADDPWMVATGHRLTRVEPGVELQLPASCATLFVDPPADVRVALPPSFVAVAGPGMTMLRAAGAAPVVLPGGRALTIR